MTVMNDDKEEAPPSMADVSAIISALEGASWRPRERGAVKRRIGGGMVLQEVTPVDTVLPRDLGPAVPLFMPGSLGASDGCFYDVKDGDLDNPLDVTAMTTHSPGRFEVVRVKRVGFKEVKRLARSILPVMYLLTQVEVGPRRASVSSVDVLGEKEDGSLWLLTNKRLRPHVGRMPANRQELTNLKIARGVALALEYSWSVVVGERDGFRVSLQTDSEGARALLTMRDVGPGERRAALLHWVTGHWRKRRGGDVEWVRRHLRGEESCSWSGIPCRVMPALADVRRLGMTETG